MKIKHITKQSDPVEEGLKDYIGLVGNALAGVVSARHRGKAEVGRVLIDAKKNFSQHMGRNGQNWATVTWNTLYKYLSMPNQLGLTGDEINRMLKDNSVKSKIIELISKQSSKQLGSAPGNQKISTDVMKKDWAKGASIIGGPEDKDSAKRAEIAVTYILELGAIKWLERSDSTSDMPDEPTTEPQAPATQQTAATQQSEPSGETGKIDRAAIDKIKQELAKIKGGS
jgi:hypothetical protein